MRSPRLLLTTAILAALLPGACTSSSTSTSTLPPSSPTNASGEPDPLVPYSPSPTPFVEITEGYAGDTLTLPTADGGTLHVTLDSTALDTRFVHELRSFDVWLTIQNAGDAGWTGFPGGFITITDASGTVWDPIPNPTPADLHPHPEVYAASNVDLHKERSIAAGATLQGVSVFRMPGGFRPVTIAISFDRGATWGSWQTSFGPY